MGFSRGVILVAVLVLSFVIPAGLCASVALLPVQSAGEFWLCLVCTIAWMLLLALVNWWEFTGLWLRNVWLTVFIVTVCWRVASTNARQPSGVTWRSVVLLGFAAAGGWLLANAIRARRPAARAVALRWPFAAGRFLITDGGDGGRSFLINYHYGFGKHRASGVSRSMRFAMDVVEVNAAGMSARGFIPGSNDRFRIWKRAVLSPCEGVVAHAVCDVEDNSAFGHNRPYGLGNHVVIRTQDDIYVALGHLRRGSVSVKTGDTVRAGDPIGAAGNSGWTERPHLHIQAMRSATGDWWHGEGVPMRFNGRFYARNRVVTAR